MDEHSLEILEFHKVRELLRRYAPCALGAERVRDTLPGINRQQVEHAQTLVREMISVI